MDDYLDSNSNYYEDDMNESSEEVEDDIDESNDEDVIDNEIKDTSHWDVLSRY